MVVELRRLYLSIEYKITSTWLLVIGNAYVMFTFFFA